MHELFRDTWVYQEILHEGHEEGLKAGLKAGMEEGIKHGQELERQIELKRPGVMLVTFVREHYPEMTDAAQSKVSSIAELEALQNIFMQVLLAKTQKQVADSLK